MIKILQHSIFFTVFLYSTVVFAQQIKSVDLGNKLTEISGLAQLATNVFVGINDSGNKAELFLFNENGESIKTVAITNATNIDWEDLAMDDTYLYIGDIGNNLNKRKDLCVYRVLKSDVLNQTKVLAEKLSYAYSNQTDFPPKKRDYNFDAEALIVLNDSLWIIAKNNAEPWNGNAAVYMIPKTPGNHVAEEKGTVFTGSVDWWEDAITGADLFEGRLYILTYNRVLVFNPNKLHEPSKLLLKFERITQKESIVVVDKNTLYIADEKQMIIGGGKLYKIEFK